MRMTSLTILLGMLLIAIITPLSQFLTMQTVNADIETASPAAWAVGLIFSLVMVVAALRLILRTRFLDKKQLVLLYTMLTIAVPVMNLGLVRQCFLSVCATMNEYLFYGTSTYRSAYNALEPDWFPVVPTQEGLAWNKAERLLRLLRDEEVTQARNSAFREMNVIIESAAAAPEDITEETRRHAAVLVEQLGMDDIVHFMQNTPAAVRLALGVEDLMHARTATTANASRAALERLHSSLPEYDEHEISLLPHIIEQTDRSSLERLDREYARMTPEERSTLQARIKGAQEAWPALSSLVTSLNDSDRAALRRHLQARYMERYEQMDEAAYQAELGSFVYRITRNERSQIIRQDGSSDTADQNLYGFFESLWVTVAERRQKDETPPRENIRYLVDNIPWNLWVRPLLHWAALIIAIFGFLMCLAEWLRRKWVDRENLAFPLVEIADNLIRHDYELETADDLRAPPLRKSLFNPVLLGGLLLGLLIITLEAAAHYRLVNNQFLLYFPFSEKLFTTGALRAFPNTVFVLSPIIVGIAFLVSLEVSFSVWASYWLFNIIYWMIHLVKPEIRDSVYTGWSGGNNYPFPMEQMLGACICFTIILVWKALHSKQASAEHATLLTEDEHGAYIPRRLNTAGMIIFPLLALALMWNLGVNNIFFLLFIGLTCLAITIAAARIRAETGLHTHHVTYEFTRLPMIFGMTGWLGTRAYTIYLSLAFLPVSLLFRTLPQQLENMELARRNSIRYSTVAAASLAAFLAAISVGMVSFILFAYYFGESFYAGESLLPPAPVASAFNLARYPLWVAHFLGESGLDKFTSVHWVRMWFIAGGAAVFGLLVFLRGRFLGFKLHPAGYLVLLLTPYFTWVSPYTRGAGAPGSAANMSLIWGSCLVAWGAKKIIIKYGGMNFYRRAKPFFIGLVLGAIVGVFFWNMLDLICSVTGHRSGDPGAFIKLFMDVVPYSPSVY